MTDKLLPCPFCGGEAYKSTFGGELHRRPSDGAALVKIECGRCVCKIERFHDKNAVEAWNTRPINKVQQHRG